MRYGLKRLTKKGLRRNKKGFTLVELVIAMGVFGIFMVALSIYLGSNLRLFARGKIEMDSKNVGDSIAVLIYEEVKSSRAYVLRDDLGPLYNLNDDNGTQDRVDELTYDDTENNHDALGNNSYIYSAGNRVYYTSKNSVVPTPLYEDEKLLNYKVYDLRFLMGGSDRNLLTITFKLENNSKSVITITKAYNLMNLRAKELANASGKWVHYFTYAGMGYCTNIGAYNQSWCGAEHDCTATLLDTVGAYKGYYNASSNTISEWCSQTGAESVNYAYTPNRRFAVLGYKRPS